jgi:hypothetical protein
MKIFEIIDPTPEYRRLKGELERLRAADPMRQWVDYMKSREKDDTRFDDPVYDKKKYLYGKLRKVYHNRWRDLTQRVDRLKGETQYYKYRDQPTGMFVKYDTVPGIESPAYIDDIGILIHQQNEALDYPASDAIDAFVGHVHGIHSDGVGIMAQRKLEDAYSDNPSEQGLLIRKQLETAMLPVRQALLSRFGDTIYLYRSQEPLKSGISHRNVLSWTASQRFANYHGGEAYHKIEAVIPMQDVVWITDRARQQEFICLNRRGASHYQGA